MIWASYQSLQLKNDMKQLIKTCKQHSQGRTALRPITVIFAFMFRIQTCTIQSIAVKRRYFACSCDFGNRRIALKRRSHRQTSRCFDESGLHYVCAPQKQLKSISNPKERALRQSGLDASLMTENWISRMLLCLWRGVILGTYIFHSLEKIDWIVRKGKGLNVLCFVCAHF